MSYEVVLYKWRSFMFLSRQWNWRTREVVGLLHSVSHYGLEIINRSHCLCSKQAFPEKGDKKKKRGKGREIMLLSFAIKINFDSSVSVTLLSVDGRVPLRKCSYLGKFRVFWASLLGEAPARLLQIWWDSGQPSPQCLWQMKGVSPHRM